MPSCVVKWCKNNTIKHKKEQGITFHRFPSANDAWKMDWVDIIRQSRGEPNWTPTKSSVVCSSHFEASDLYLTENGRLRVVNYGVPKKMVEFNTENAALSQQPLIVSSPSTAPPQMVEIKIENPEQPLIVRSPSAISPQMVQIKTENVIMDIEPLSAVGSPSTALPQMVVCKTENVSDSEDPLITTQSYPADVKPFLHVPSETENVVSNPENLLIVKCEFPSTPLAQNSPDIGETMDTLVQPPDSPRTKGLKFELKKKNERIEKQAKLIKTLNQKVRRLQERNKCLKNKIIDLCQ